MEAANLTATLIVPRIRMSTEPKKPSCFSLYPPTNRRTKDSVLSLTRCSTTSNTEGGRTSQEQGNIESDASSKSRFPSEAISFEWSSSSAPSSSTSGLVLDLGPADSWDGAEIGSPVVKRFLSDEEERWYMWYHGSSSQKPGSDSIGLAVSSNGIHWERGTRGVKSSGDVGMVMKCSENWWAFDTGSVRPSEIMIMSSTKVRSSSAVYWLYYTGYASEKAETFGDSSGLNLQNPERFRSSDQTGEEITKVSKSLPGLAISQDGRYWARIEGEHYSGALFDTGSEKDWDFPFVASPHVVFHTGGDLRMYYHSYDPQNCEYCIGIARSRDGIKWVKLGKILGGRKRKGCFDEFGVVNPCVVRNKRSNNYIMAYEGVGGDGRRSIGLATSEDGLKGWRRLEKGSEDQAVMGPGEASGWDSEGVGSPYLVQIEGECDHEWRLYYRGVGCGGRTGIGMAVSEGRDIQSFRRWTGFRL